MKREILYILRNQPGYISGQALCEKFGVSRTAIWKVINQLKAEGYEIEAVPNRGYQIKSCPDLISADEVLSLLDTKWAGREVYYYPVVDSTNTRGKRLAEEGVPHGTLVLADDQSGGKGRRGRGWTNPAKKTIAMSLIVRPELQPVKASMLTLVMGMAVCSACCEILDRPVQIKWPNDVVLEGKKLCGILTEMSAELLAIHYLVIGAGVNVNLWDFPDELKDKATSLCIYAGQEISRARVISRVMHYFEGYYQRFMATADMSDLRDDYQAMLVNINEKVKVLEPGQEYHGIARGINEQGELLVERTDGRIEKVFAGEVSVRGIYGYV